MGHLNLILIFSLLCVSSYCQLTQANRDKLIKLHNDFRTEIANGLAGGNFASNMNLLTWDSNLEAYAQAYVNTCPTSKNPAKLYNELILPGNYGTYQAPVSYADYDWMFNNWKNMKSFQNTTAAIDAPTSISAFHYLAWADAETFGCGVAACVNNSNNYITLVCDYKGPYTLMQYDPVWLRGPQASACPPGRTASGVLCAGQTIYTPPQTVTSYTPTAQLPKGTYGPMSGNQVYTTTDEIAVVQGVFIEAGISANQRQQFVDAHNQKRQLVADGKGQWPLTGTPTVQQPAASNMKFMVYDARDESIPINWAKTCPNGHNPQNGDYGENIYWAWGQEQPRLGLFPVAKAVDAWYSEIQYMNPSLVYDLAQAWDTAPSAIGHYTQVVWADTNQLLCGISVCKVTSSCPWLVSVICNYGPAGNYWGEPVYQEGQKCSQCPAGTVCGAAPYDGLCVPI